MAPMLYLKAFHVISMVTWFAGLFYLPRLFVYHAMSEDPVGRARFCVMERKLYRGIMTPGAIATVVCGSGLLYGYAWDIYRYSPWLWIKLSFVAATIAYHLVCGHYVRAFAVDRVVRGHVFFRVFNEIPVIFLVVIIIMAIAKPF
jgi:putative membrane protein